MVRLFEHLDRETAESFSLVLSAVGIGHRVTGACNRFHLDVPAPQTDAALAAIARYQSENSKIPPEIPPRLRRPLPLSGIFVAFALLAVHLAVSGSQAPQDYQRVFGADARLIMDGQLYRCATALLIHADATHIVGNMAGIALFGSVVCTMTGTGMGWLMILACGISGNLINAWAYELNHLSVGASTAIFGALGIVCALQALAAIRTGKGWRQVALVAGSGLALLALLGAGTQSDLGAHLFGWLSGLIIGGGHGLCFNRPLGARWQLAGGLTAGLVLLAAWFCGVAGS